MNEIQRYLQDEVVLDCADGIISRREALRRLGLMGLTAAAASNLLAGCGDTKEPNVPASASTHAAGGGAESVTFAGPEGRTLRGAWARADSPRGGVLVIHENKGLLEHFRVVAQRFAMAGYSALAVDLLSEEGGTAALGEPANATAALSKTPPERFVADMKAGLDELAKRTPGVKLGAIGFCFGGGMTWRLVGTKDPRLAAAAPFYGPLPEGADFTGAKTAVLGVYAELDGRVNASQPAAKAALEKAGLTHEIVTYPGADHAFFNDTGPRYNSAAATQAWSKVLDWFGRYVG
ncbi:dienelactone hydrolase family protein [Pendulispora brunnea]|uniref:Dienelactone hydrolase family protein n=1 Tax=Pendulispora brunnea TaxID=2905690 RepID=A0ABZ2KJJ5_9BACT